MGMGTGLSNAGPAGLLICFAVVGALLWTVIQSLGEMSAFISVSGQCLFIMLHKCCMDF
jgi:amino acid transporter